MHLNYASYPQYTTEHHGYTTNYNPLPTQPSQQEIELRALEEKDFKLKRRIRIMKVVSRTIATILSVATFVPLVLTFEKFLATRNTYFTVDGEIRTAWASPSEPQYLYAYLGVATVSLIVNGLVTIAYFRGVKRANEAPKVAGWWSKIYLTVHLLVWIGGTAYYRYGNHMSADGKFHDLWGWTCSSAAQDIQGQVPDVNFGQYCTIQSSSFYAGILQVVAEILSTMIYIFALMRLRSKRRVKKQTAYVVDLGKEPLRHGVR